MYVVPHRIERGRVRVERAHPQLTEPILLAELGPGEVVGEMGVLDGAPATWGTRSSPTTCSAS